MSVKTLHVEATVDKYGCLHLDIPSDLPEGRVKLRVTIESLPEDTERLQQVGAKQLASPLLSAIQLMKLPLKERHRILEAAEVEAAEEYRRNRELTEFEAFSEDDLYAETDER